MNDKIINMLWKLEKYRKYILASAVLFIGVAALVFVHSHRIIKYYTGFLSTGELYVLSPTEGFTSLVDISIFFSGLCLLPIIIALVVLLFSRDKKSALLSGIVSALLTVLSLAFNNYVLIPNVISFLAKVAEQTFVLTVSAASYVKFIGALLFLTAVIFQLPVLITVLYSKGIITSTNLRSARKYFYIAAFILMAILTPTPDAFTLILSTIPVIALFEISALIIFVLDKRENR